MVRFINIILIYLKKIGLAVIIVILFIKCVPNHQEHPNWFGKLKPEYTTILGVNIGYSSFQELSKIFGYTNKFEQQIECCKHTYFCYKSKAGNNPIAVVFEGDSWDKTVETINVSQYDSLAELLSYVPGALKTDFLGNHCVVNDKIPNVVRIGDLTFGITQEQLYKKWGKPSYWDNNIMTYNYFADEKINDKLILRFTRSYPIAELIKYPFVNVLSRIRIQFKNDKLVGFSIYQSFQPTGKEEYKGASNILRP